METTVGTCALCRNLRELRDSHLLPKALYRFVRLTSKSRGSSPIVVTPKAVWTTDAQIRKHLLCAECEQRFHKTGEDWTLRQIYRGENSFKLLDALRRLRPMGENADSKVYDVSDVPEIDTEKLAYFGASVFWRAAVATWRIDKNVLQQLNFGPVYLEGLRRYLLGEIRFPENLAMSVQVCDDPALSATTLALPTGGRVESYHKYFFAVPGVAFHLLIGKAIPNLMRQMCIATGLRRVILLRNYQQMIKDSFYAKMRTSKVSKRLQ